MTLKIVVAVAGFQRELTVREAASAVGAGLRRIQPDVEVIKLPFVEGGEGFTAALVDATGGAMHPASVTGPWGDSLKSFFGLLGGEGPRSLVIEAAAAVGTSLLASADRDPGPGNSCGVGQLLQIALSAGAERILLGCADTLLLDGGVGMARALGFRFLDGQDREIGEGVDALRRLARIDGSQADPRLAEVRIDAVVDWHSVLLGSSGVAQSMAFADRTREARLEEAFGKLASALADASGHDVGLVAGSGAAKGLGATIQALLGGNLRPLFDAMSEYLALDQSLETADLVLVVDGEAAPRGPEASALAKVARQAKLQGAPVFALGIAPETGRGPGLTADLFLHVEPPRAEGANSGMVSSKSLIRAAEEAMRLALTSRFARDARRKAWPGAGG
ncbi:MAG: glycerate kinase [Kiloniellales bacterium]|nr:glycerate kinase [Kiloniellales bacterium]